MASLRLSKLFSALNDSEVAELDRCARQRDFKAGAVVFREGDAGDGIYTVIEGKVQISALVGQDQRRVLSEIGPGDFFGEMAVLDNEPRSATVTAESDSKLLFVPRTDVLQMIERSPRLAVNLVRQFSLRMRDFNRRYMKEVLQAERLTLVGRFARSIVHDFKNPLNVIGLSAELAAMEGLGAESRVSARNRIRKQVDRMSNMINELLEFTRGTQSNIILAETNYANYVNHLVEELRQEVAVKGITIVLQPPPSELTVLLDPARLTHVFYNLVHNGVDAMPTGGTITISFSQKGAEMSTEVADTGAGIAPEIAGQLFEAFATYGKAQGTGLGLSICRKIIEDHRGRISAHNGPNGGAVFTFTLPIKP